MPSFLRRAYNSITRLGVKRSMESVLSVAEDAIFDLRLGTDTTARIPQSALHVINPKNQAQAQPYVMTRARALRRAFLRSGAPRDRGFVDIGSGKGKVVITAALFGFKHIVGIEFAPELVKIAQHNLDKVKTRLPPGVDVKVVCADATQHPYGPDDCVFFLYNPFGADVMNIFCAQLNGSLARYPRKIWVIYTDPAFIEIMHALLPVHEEARMTYGGFEIALLTNDKAAE